MRFFSTLLVVFWGGVALEQPSFKQNYTKANILNEDGLFSLAIRLYDKMLVEQPDNANIHYKAGRAHLDMGVDKGKALPHFQAAAKRIENFYDPLDPYIQTAPVETYYYLGHTFHLLSELDSVEWYFDLFLD